MQRSMRSKAALSHRFSNCIIGAYSVSSILYSLSTLVGNDNTNTTLNSVEQKLLLKMEFPFETSESPIHELIITSQLIMQWFAAMMAGMLLALIVTLILHVGSQIEIICDGLEKLYRNGSGSSKLVLRSLIVKHQRVISLADAIEELFTYMSLMQFLANTVVICFLAFVLVISMDTPEGSNVIVKCLPYYVLVNFEAFILCSTGEYLSFKSQTIGHAAYDCLWYELNPRESRILLLLILRSQRQLTLTAGRFMQLSLESFASILKASCSYASVLRAMY